MRKFLATVLFIFVGLPLTLSSMLLISTRPWCSNARPTSVSSRTTGSTRPSRSRDRRERSPDHQARAGDLRGSRPCGRPTKGSADSGNQGDRRGSGGHGPRRGRKPTHRQGCPPRYRPAPAQGGPEGEKPCSGPRLRGGPCPARRLAGRRDCRQPLPARGSLRGAVGRSRLGCPTEAVAPAPSARSAGASAGGWAADGRRLARPRRSGRTRASRRPCSTMTARWRPLRRSPGGPRRPRRERSPLAFVAGGPLPSPAVGNCARDRVALAIPGGLILQNLLPHASKAWSAARLGPSFEPILPASSGP